MKKKLQDIIRWMRDFFKHRLQYKNEDLPYYITILVALILFGSALKIFIELTDELSEGELKNFDDTITVHVLSFRNPSLTLFFQFITNLGDRIAYTAATILLGAFLWFRFRNWKFTAQIVSVLLLATLSNIAIKHIIKRSRPSIEHLVSVNTLSFPSGHSMSAMAFYGFLVYLCVQSKMNRWIKIILCLVLIALIFSIGLSRIYLGVHFPSDVVAGFMGGLIWVTFCAITFNVLELWRKKRKKPTEPEVPIN
jgi:membrane-associated phospholipid phosphatase